MKALGRHAPLGALLLCACTVATDFGLERTAETTEALCSDGLDNDADGFKDCQDWACLGQKTCCTIPAVVLADDFEGIDCYNAPCDQVAASCEPDPDRWRGWGSPEPIICEGGLWPNKLQGGCYVVGELSVEALVLDPGLSLVVGVAGQPEPLGKVIVGMTLRDEIPGSSDPCDLIETLVPAVDVTVEAAPGGARAVAHFERSDMGTSPVYADDGRHDVRLSIGEDRRFHFALDGEEFAASPADRPLPEGIRVHLALAGRGLAAHFEDVRVTSLAQCDDPLAWQPSDLFVALSGSGIDGSWDKHQARHPWIVRSEDGALDLYYTGCSELGTCLPLDEGIGRAHARPGYPFVRDPMNPLSGYGSWTDFFADFQVAVLGGAPRRAYISNEDEGRYIRSSGFDADGRLDSSSASVKAISVGADGAWDDGTVCCASPVEHDGRILVWYAGRRKGDVVWSIGLAVSEDGERFDKSPANPVLMRGPAGAFDGQGVTAPSVVFDEARSLYRMWYAGRGFFDETAIGYAVSVDGVTWERSPQNPVVTGEAFGLVYIGDPSVLSEEGRLRMLIEAKAPGGHEWAIYALENEGRQVGQGASRAR